MKSFIRGGAWAFVFTFLMGAGFVGYWGCGSSTGDSTTTTGIQVTGTITGLSSDTTLFNFSKPNFAVYNNDPSLCPDNTGGGVSTNITPTSYKVALKRLTLLGDSSTGTSNDELFSASSIDNAYIADFVNDTEFFSSSSYPTSGTYNGIEIELYYLEMAIPMIVPAISATEATYTTRGYFSEVGNLLPRDVTVFSNGTEYWINRQTDVADPYGIVAVTETHPFQVLDLWSDEAFWGRDLITISTADTQFGTDFTFTMTDGSSSFAIPSAPSSTYTIQLSFDVIERFTFWEYLENGDNADADGNFTVGFDCGYRILFPNVEISMSSS